MDVPGGPGVVGAIKAGTGISITPDGTISVNGAENITKLVAGDNCTLTPATGVGAVTVTFTGGGGPGPDVPAGTVMSFFQASAPTGWTKNTNYNNVAVRVVSGGGGGGGGSQDFTTVFSSVPVTGTVAVSGVSVSGTVQGTVLSVAQIGSHSHTVRARGASAPTSFQGTPNPGETSMANLTTSAAGSNVAHSHSFNGAVAGGNATFTGNSLNLAVRYVDCILCTKN